MSGHMYQVPMMYAKHLLSSIMPPGTYYLDSGMPFKPCNKRYHELQVHVAAIGGMMRRKNKVVSKRTSVHVVRGENRFTYHNATRTTASIGGPFPKNDSEESSVPTIMEEDLKLESVSSAEELEEAQDDSDDSSSDSSLESAASESDDDIELNEVTFVGELATVSSDSESDTLLSIGDELDEALEDSSEEELDAVEIPKPETLNNMDMALDSDDSSEEQKLEGTETTPDESGNNTQDTDEVSMDKSAGEFKVSYSRSKKKKRLRKKARTKHQHDNAKAASKPIITKKEDDPEIVQEIANLVGTITESDTNASDGAIQDGNPPSLTWDNSDLEVPVSEYKSEMVAEQSTAMVQTEDLPEVIAADDENIKDDLELDRDSIINQVVDKLDILAGGIESMNENIKKIYRDGTNTIELLENNVHSKVSSIVPGPLVVNPNNTVKLLEDMIDDYDKLRAADKKPDAENLAMITLSAYDPNIQPVDAVKVMNSFSKIWNGTELDEHDKKHLLEQLKENISYDKSFDMIILPKKSGEESNEITPPEAGTDTSHRMTLNEFGAIFRPSKELFVKLCEEYNVTGLAVQGLGYHLSDDCAKRTKTIPSKLAGSYFDQLMNIQPTSQVKYTNSDMKVALNNAMKDYVNTFSSKEQHILQHVSDKKWDILGLNRYLSGGFERDHCIYAAMILECLMSSSPKGLPRMKIASSVRGTRAWNEDSDPVVVKCALLCAIRYPISGKTVDVATNPKRLWRKSTDPDKEFIDYITINTTDLHNYLTMHSTRLGKEKKVKDLHTFGMTIDNSNLKEKYKRVSKVWDCNTYAKQRGEKKIDYDEWDDVYRRRKDRESDHQGRSRKTKDPFHGLKPMNYTGNEPDLIQLREYMMRNGGDKRRIGTFTVYNTHVARGERFYPMPVGGVWDPRYIGWCRDMIKNVDLAKEFIESLGDVGQDATPEGLIDMNAKGMFKNGEIHNATNINPWSHYGALMDTTEIVDGKRVLRGTTRLN